jgi:hypothetical protein
VRRAVFGLLGTLMLAAVACGATQPSAAQRATNQQFVDYVHEKATDIGRYKNDGKLVSLGRAVCDGFRARANIQQIADLLERTGGRNLPPADIGAVISGAVKFLCPAYSGRLNPVQG